MKHQRLGLGFLVAAILGSGSLYAVPVTLTKLTGLTGGTLGATAVYRADLSAIGFDILSISITDNSVGLGGAGGQFSGFDLDAVILSRTLATDASGAAALVPGEAVFDYPNGAFVPGSQRVPTDPKLFGTGPTGLTVDNSVATLGSFDGESTTAIPGADGFISLGDGGKISFNLTSSISPATGLYLYIGEVGDNGEVAASAIDVSSSRVSDGGSSIALIGIALAGLAAIRRRFV